MVMAQMLEGEMAARVGSTHAKVPGRQATWHGATKGPVILGEREVIVTRPWGRAVDDKESNWSHGLRPLRKFCWSG